MIEATQIDEFPVELRLYIKTLLTICAYAGSGNVMKIQELQQIVAKKKEDVNEKVKQIAIIGMSIIALGEDIGMEMLPRSFNHFLQFGDVTVKKAVPLAYAMLYFDVALNAVFSLGVVTAGTNNSRISSELRKMAGAYAEEQKVLPFIRLAQGLLNLDIGLAGIIISLLSFTEGEGLVGGKYQYLLYSLCLGLKPRMVMTLGEDLQLKPISLAVGQAVDTIGLPGNPKTISGFQVNTTPLLLNASERCEMSNDDYIAESNILEDVVIVKENPKDQRN